MRTLATLCCVGISLAWGANIQPGIVSDFGNSENNGTSVQGDSFWRSECRSWKIDEIYLEGDKVEFGGEYYQAKWWSSGNQPGGSAGWNDWQLIGSACSPPTQESGVIVAGEDNQEEEEEKKDGLEEKEEEESNIESADSGENEIHYGPGEKPSKQFAEKREKQLTNSKLFIRVKHSISTINSHKVDLITPGGDSNPVNVRRVEKILSEEDWEYLFPDRNQDYTYRRFLQAVGKFPAICADYTDGRNPEEICRRTLATMFAHFTQETGGHNPHSEVEQWRQGLVFLREAGCQEDGPGCGYDSACDPNTWQGKTWPCGKAGGRWQKYYGRGAKQLSYNFNYGPFSDAMFGDVAKLLENPDLVASTWLNLASATWFYVYPQPPKPSMLHVIDGTWIPNEEDRKNKLEPGFGATIMIINGGIECGHGYEKPQATNRQEYYKNFAKYFKLDISGEELSCAHMSQFSKGGAGSLHIYWDREWTREYECQLVTYQTPFSALKQGDYVRCVEDQFKVKLE